MNVRICCVFLVLLFTFASVKAQNTRILPVSGGTANIVDSIPKIEIDAESLNHIIDIKKQFELQNKTYSVPIRLNSDLLRFMKKDELTISPEAMYWARWVRDASTIFDSRVTFRDTVIANPIFLSPVFRGNILPDNLKLYEDIGWKSAYKDSYAFMYEPDTTLFADYYAKKKTEESMATYLETKHISLFRFAESHLPGETIETSIIRKPVYENISLKVEPELKSPEEMDALQKFIPDRRYWQSGFESAIQFSQNYITDNWYKGGSSNLNLFTKNHLKYDYKKDKLQLTNEIEIKASFYNAPKDTLHAYKIGDDLLRLHSNFGYQAFKKWYYTLDGEFKTQMFSNHKENSKIKQAAFLSPFTVNLGVGMKYDLSKKYKTRHKNLKLSINLAPFSYTYMYSVSKDSLMDLGRHGFKKKIDPVAGKNAFENSLSRFGSTVRADMTMNFSRHITWQSRVYYFTTYESVTAEFENTLTLALTRHFSTRIYAHLRYDDSVTKTADFDSYFQLNELLSFGFNYKW